MFFENANYLPFGLYSSYVCGVYNMRRRPRYPGHHDDRHHDYRDDDNSDDNDSDDDDNDSDGDDDDDSYHDDRYYNNNNNNGRRYQSNPQRGRWRRDTVDNATDAAQPLRW